MRWTEFLTDEAERTYAITARLLDMVEPDRLTWKPENGLNWMTTGQLLQHLSNACGQPCKGLVTGDWGLPDGTTLEDLTPEEMTPSAENLPGVSSVTGVSRPRAGRVPVSMSAVTSAMTPWPHMVL